MRTREVGSVAPPTCTVRPSIGLMRRMQEAHIPAPAYNQKEPIDIDIDYLFPEY
jgi:hypothetical protein